MKELDRKRRSYRIWTPEEITRLREIFPTTSNLRELGTYFPTRTLDSVHNACKMRGLYRTAQMTKDSLFSRPQSLIRKSWEAIPKYDQFERLIGDYAISSDWHISKLDPNMLSLKAKIAKKHGITKAIIVGDVFDQDEFSHWSIAGLQPKDVQFGDELIYAAQAFEDALIAFPDGIWITSGNHDERILRLLRFALELSDVFSLIGRRMAEGLRRQFEQKVKVSSYPFCTINGTWYACHPSTYSKIPCAVARDVAETEHMNTIMAGGHIWGLSKDKSGKFYCVDLGIMADPLKVFYKVMRVKRYPKWTQGFMMLKNGLPTLYDRNMAENC